MVKAQQNIFSRVFYDRMESGIQASAITHTMDNSYILAGTNANNGFVLKTDAFGLPQWNKTFNLPNSNSVFSNIISCSDSGFLLSGNTYNVISGRMEALYVKINSSGDTLWSKITSLNNTNIFIVDGEQTSDSGFILTGYSSQNDAPYHNRIFTARLDVSGNMLWTNTSYVGNINHIGYSVKQTPDDGFLIIGTFSDCSPCYSHTFLIKLTSAGFISWSKEYSLSSGANCNGFDFVIVPDGYVCYLNSGLMKTDFAGNIVWTKFYNFSLGGSCNNCAPKLLMTSDSAFILLAGGFYGFGGSTIVKTDPDGNILWADDLVFNAADISETKNRGLLIAGNGPLLGVKSPEVFAPQIGIIKTDSLGAGMECVFSTGFAPRIDTVVASDKEFTSETGSNYDERYHKNVYPDINSLDIVDYDGCVDFLGGLAETGKINSFTVFPNPAGNKVSIEYSSDYKDAMLTIYNTNMQLLMQLPLEQKHTELDISEFSSGIYFVMIKTKNSVDVLKLVKK